MLTKLHRRAARTLTIVAGLALLAPTLAGCETTDCTAVGWIEGLTVGLGMARLPDGGYEIAVSDDRVTLTVEFIVTGGVLSCGDCSFTAQRADGSKLGVDLHGNGAAVQGQGLAFLNVYNASKQNHVRGGPEAVTIRLLREGVELAAQTFEPEYTSTELNGPGCGEAIRAHVLWNLVLD